MHWWGKKTFLIPKLSIKKHKTLKKTYIIEDIKYPDTKMKHVCYSYLFGTTDPFTNRKLWTGPQSKTTLCCGQDVYVI